MAEKKKGKTQKKEDGAEHGPDFKYIVRIANSDIDGEKKIAQGLTSILGINDRIALIIARDMGLDTERLMGDLTDDEVKTLVGNIESIPEKLPAWLLNRQRDMDTGEDTHAISIELEMTQREDINLLRKIRSYRGIRHETGQKVRGQRSRSNGRTGSTVGVSRKKSG